MKQGNAETCRFSQFYFKDTHYQKKKKKKSKISIFRFVVAGFFLVVLWRTEKYMRSIIHSKSIWENIFRRVLNIWQNIWVNSTNNFETVWK